MLGLEEKQGNYIRLACADTAPHHRRNGDCDL